MSNQNVQPVSSLTLSQRLTDIWPRLAPVIESVARVPSAVTIRQYRAAILRMQLTDSWPEEIGKQNRRSFNLYRAALTFIAVKRIRLDYSKIINALDGDLRANEVEELFDNFNQCLRILDRYPAGKAGAKCRWNPPPGGQTRKGKRRGLARLPPNWRLQMASACPINSPYSTALLVSALVGVRPEELRRGVNVYLNHDSITVHIQGAKVTSTTGQPVRILTFSVDSPLARMLVNLIKQRDGGAVFEVSIDDPRKFCDFIRALSRRVFQEEDYIVSPYSFRHAFASDQKAIHTSRETLARSLGHVSVRSQRAYGTTGQGRPPPRYDFRRQGPAANPRTGPDKCQDVTALQSHTTRVHRLADYFGHFVDVAEYDG